MAQSCRFGNAELLPVERRLLVDGLPVDLGARAFDVLVALVERRDRVATKNELLDAAWPGLVVEENNLAAQVSALRKVLGAHAIATIPGIGYRLALAVDGIGAQVLSGSARGTGHRTNIPGATESLIGRDTNLSAIRALLGEHRLVTIVGPGGIGKSRLAQEAARALAPHFPDGTWWVDLATVPTPAMVVPAIAHAVGVRLAGGDPAEELARSIGERRMLIVLDNGEYVAAQLAILARPLLSRTFVRILVTSQELLRIPEEVHHDLQGLEVADENDPVEIQFACAALQLLQRRARAADPHFTLDQEGVRTALELCRRLDGIALAIEMAAARIPLVGLNALMRRLEERLDLLRNVDRTAPLRHRTLRATLEWSYSLLSDTEKTVLRRLSTFVGGFRLDAALQVASGSELDEWECLDCLSALVDRSLVKIVHADPPRYRLLESTRLFGLELLAEYGETEAAIRNHAGAMACLSDAIVEAFDQRGEDESIREHCDDYDDLRVAWERGCEREDAEMASGTIHSLTKLDFARGSYGPMWHRQSEAQRLAPNAQPLARARLWNSIAVPRGSYGLKGGLAAREEVSAWRLAGDRQRLFEALGNLAGQLALSGRLEEGESTLAEMRLLEDTAWPVQIQMAYLYPATMLAGYGLDMALFRARIDEQESAGAKIHASRFAVISSIQRLVCAMTSGDLHLALELGEIAMRVCMEHGNPFAIANSRLRYCSALLLSGRLEPVPALLQQSLAVLRSSPIVALTFDSLALYAVRAGHATGALKLLGFADNYYSEAGHVRLPVDVRMGALAFDEAASRMGSEQAVAMRAAGGRLQQAEVLEIAAEILRSARASIEPAGMQTDKVN